jgi:endonuclease YncB( thermonuclease family)
MRTVRLLLPLLLVAAAPPAGPPPTHGVVKSVYDGDTLTLASGDKIRLKWANTPEMKPKEAYADEARTFTDRFVGGQDVQLGVNPDSARDGYGRVLASVSTSSGDLSLGLLENGLAHVYIIPPVDGDPAPYLAAQAKAKAARLGIWSTDNFQGALHITSFHANAPGDESLDPNLEYVRICNVAGEEVDLAGFVVTDREGQRFVLPAVKVPAGHTVKLLSGKGADQTDPAKQLEVHLGSAQPIWGNDWDQVTLFDPSGAVVDAKEHKVAPKK